MSSRSRPPYDAELAGAYGELSAYEVTLDVSAISVARGLWPPPDHHAELAGRSAELEELTVPGFEGVPIPLTMVQPTNPTLSSPNGKPGVLLIHGGGMYMGHPHHQLPTAIDLVEGHHIVAAGVGYRLAPEHRHPVPVEDCYAALAWFHEHAQEFGVDPHRIVVWGQSAGGGLAAAVALLARNRGGPPLLGQVLLCPMLDDRNDSTSAQQFDGTRLWDRTENAFGWSLLSGPVDSDRQQTPRLDLSPARVENLAGLPPAFLDVGSAEVFRDETVSYATRLWAAGGDAELHVWPGGFHGYEKVVPDAAISQSTEAARHDWLRRLLTRSG